MSFSTSSLDDETDETPGLPKKSTRSNQIQVSSTNEINV